MLTFPIANKAVTAYQRARADRKRREALSGLNDHMLRDIGLTRDDLFR